MENFTYTDRMVGLETRREIKLPGGGGVTAKGSIRDMNFLVMHEFVVE